MLAVVFLISDSGAFAPFALVLARTQTFPVTINILHFIATREIPGAINYWDGVLNGRWRGMAEFKPFSAHGETAQIPRRTELPRDPAPVLADD